MLRRLINANRFERKLIVIPDVYEWRDVPFLRRRELKSFTGLHKIVYREGDLERLANEFRNGVLVFDDFKALFIAKRRELDALRSLAIRRRQRNIDIYISAHGFTEIVPTYLFSFTTKIILFKTLDNPARVRDRLLNYNFILERQRHVNETADRDPHYFEIISFA